MFAAILSQVPANAALLFAGSWWEANQVLPAWAPAIFTS